jgi:hypothetical protein
MPSSISQFSEGEGSRPMVTVPASAPGKGELGPQRRLPQMDTPKTRMTTPVHDLGLPAADRDSRTPKRVCVKTDKLGRFLVAYSKRSSLISKANWAST